MNPEQLKVKLKEIIASNQDKLFKKLGVIAVFTKALTDLNVKPVIVGGQAVEFYKAKEERTIEKAKEFKEEAEQNRLEEERNDNG